MALPSSFPIIGASGAGDASSDIYQRLLKERIVFLGSAIDQVSQSGLRPADPLESEDREGHFGLHQLPRRVGDGRHGHLRHHAVRPARRVHDLLRAGGGDGPVPSVRRRPGKRFALPHSRILMHQPSGGIQGQAADIAIQAEQIVYTKRMMAERIAQHTGQPIERIEADSDRDRWFTAEEAREYGFIDQVIERSAARGRCIGVALEPGVLRATAAPRGYGCTPGSKTTHVVERPVERTRRRGNKVTGLSLRPSGWASACADLALP